jgi:hypothetical protein
VEIRVIRGKRLNPTHFVTTFFAYICSISDGVPCRIDKLFYSAERRAEIIPVERNDFFHKPDPGNTGVGKSIQSQISY